MTTLVVKLAGSAGQRGLGRKRAVARTAALHDDERLVYADHLAAACASRGVIDGGHRD